jgi:hypothetical protein
VADGGGARPESTRESGLPVAGGSGPGAGSDGEARALERRGRRGVGTGGRVGAVVGAAERERKERGGGPAAEVPRGVGRRCGAWPRPAGSAPTVSRPTVTRTRCALASTGRAPVEARVGSAGGERARVGWSEKKAGWPSPDEQ